MEEPALLPDITAHIVRFGAYEADLHSSELRKGEVRIRLGEQPFRVLAMLVERPGEVVTRQRLQKRLWPAETFVDFEDGLNAAIKKLRAALNDSADHPLYIETLPRRGYRFIAPVEIIAGNGARPSSSAAVVPAPAAIDTGAASGAPRRRASDRFRWPIRAAFVAAIVLATFLFWWYTPVPPPRVTGISRITTSAHIDTPVKPVSDGARVYYMERDGGHWNLMQTADAGGGAQRIPIGAMNAAVLDVSPDLSKLLIGTFGVRGNPFQLWTMPVQGGALMRLGNVAATSAVFSPDGRQIAYIADAALWIMDADTTNALRLADLPGTASWLAWSPDGQRLRFTIGPLLTNAATSLWEISSAGKNLHELLPGWTRPPAECCGSWTPDGRYYAFSSSHSGQSNLWMLRERGPFWRHSPKGPFQLTRGPDSPWSSTPSRDGRRLFFYNGMGHEQLQRFDLSTHQFSLLAPNQHVFQVTYSRDGKWMAYIDHEKGTLVRSDVDSTDPLELASSQLDPSFPRISPNGKWIAFQSNRMDALETILVVPATGGQPEILLRSDTELGDADWSSDGRKLVVSRALGAKEADGRELLLVDFATRKTERIPGAGGLAMSRWSPDGRYISATEASQRELKLWNVSTKQWREIARGTAIGISVWSPDSRYLYFQDLLAPGEPLYRYDIKRERVEAVTEFSAILRSGIDRCALNAVTPDGSPVVAFNRAAYDLYAADLDLP